MTMKNTAEEATIWVVEWKFSDKVYCRKFFDEYAAYNLAHDVTCEGYKFVRVTRRDVLISDAF